MRGSEALPAAFRWCDALRTHLLSPQGQEPCCGPACPGCMRSVVSEQLSGCHRVEWPPRGVHLAFVLLSNGLQVQEVGGRSFYLAILFYC